MTRLRYINRQTSYKDWQQAMWNNGFDFSLTMTCEYLFCSKRWFQKEIQPHLNYVVYDSRFIYEKIGASKVCLTYFRKQDIADWIMQNAKFEAQTEIIDLYSYLANANKSKALKILNRYKEIFANKFCHYKKGTLPPVILKKIREDFNISSALYKNLSCTNRRKYSFKSVEPFNIFEHCVFTPNEHQTLEMSYRVIFNRGDIKVTIGRKHVLFVQNEKDISNFKMPFRIQKDAKIIVK